MWGGDCIVSQGFINVTINKLVKKIFTDVDHDVLPLLSGQNHGAQPKDVVLQKLLQASDGPLYSVDVQHLTVEMYLGGCGRSQNTLVTGEWMKDAQVPGMLICTPLECCPYKQGIPLSSEQVTFLG